MRALVESEVTTSGGAPVFSARLQRFTLVNSTDSYGSSGGGECHLATAAKQSLHKKSLDVVLHLSRPSPPARVHPPLSSSSSPYITSRASSTLAIAAWEAARTGASAVGWDEGVALATLREAAAAAGVAVAGVEASDGSRSTASDV
jgi:hypothetical protein